MRPPGPDLRTTTNAWSAPASRAAHPSSPSADEHGHLFGSIAAGLAAVTVPAALVDPDGPSEVTREVLLETTSYVAWLMAWPPGSSVEIHAHDDLVAVSVVEGHLSETVITPDGAEQHRLLGEGSTVELPKGFRHRLGNTGGRVATSVHVHARGTR